MSLSTYSRVTTSASDSRVTTSTTSKDDINTNPQHWATVGLKVTGKKENLKIIHWLPKMRKTQRGKCCFIADSNQSGTKPLT